jgi:hypothetical protein
MKHAIAGLIMLLSAACIDSGRPGIVDESPGIDLTADVNLQLGDTPVGQQPGYIVTGAVSARRGGTPIAASIDSVVISYRRNADQQWTRLVGRSTLPFSGKLPYIIQPNETYDVKAVLFARAAYSGAVATATDEWLDSGRAY